MSKVGSTFEIVRQGIFKGLGSGDAASGHDFFWPETEDFDWARDWFDEVARGNHDPALMWHDRHGGLMTLSYDTLREHSDRVAGWLVRHGVGSGTRVVVALDESAALWEIHVAALRLGAVIVPVLPGVRGGDLLEVMAFSGSTVVIAQPRTAQEMRPSSVWTGVTVGGRVAGWAVYENAHQHPLRPQARAMSRPGDPFLFECEGVGTSSGRLRGWLHSRYACCVGRLSDLWFTGLRPGDRFVSAARAGSMEHLCFSVLGPLTAGSTTVLIGGERETSVVDVVERARAVGARRAYVPATLLDGASGGRPSPDLELISSAAAAPAGTAGQRASGSAAILSRVHPDIRWGLRHGQTTTALMTSPGEHRPDGEIRATALPGHSLRIVAPVTGAPAEAGTVWLDLIRWPEFGVPGPARFGKAQRRPGTDTVPTGLYGRRTPDGGVLLRGARPTV
ncbi:AMP-binding protein [Streptomyces sp. NPDC101178]|uniref:AMP-binding protein n=1 Tax=Streptomyces sp. NPDC101178 TaxID=3366124 RepID=UPI0037F25CCD